MVPLILRPFYNTKHSTRKHDWKTMQRDKDSDEAGYDALEARIEK
jgi:hypothetical protein